MSTPEATNLQVVHDYNDLIYQVELLQCLKGELAAHKMKEKKAWFAVRNQRKIVDALKAKLGLKETPTVTRVLDSDFKQTEEPMKVINTDR